MAKRTPPTKVKALFLGPDVAITDINYKEIETKPGDLKFLHLERKGNRWLLLHSQGMVFDETPSGLIDVIRTENQQHRSYELSLLTPDGRAMWVSRYTTIATFAGNTFFHLDELDDHTFRITHDRKFFGSDKAEIGLEGIRFEIEEAV